MRGDVKRTLAEINQHFRLHGMSFCSKKFEIFKGNLNPKEINMKSSIYVRVEVKWKIKSSLLCYSPTTTTTTLYEKNKN